MRGSSGWGRVPPVWALATPIQVPDCFRLQPGGETAGPTLQGLQLLQSAVKITLLYNQFSTVKNSIIFKNFKYSFRIIKYLHNSTTSKHCKVLVSCSGRKLCNFMEMHGCS